MQIVINEIMQDKIYLDTEMNVQVAAGSRPARWTSTSATYERPRAADRRHRRDRGLQDRGLGEPIGAGRGGRERRHDPLGHAIGRAENLRGARPAGRWDFASSGRAGHPHIELAARAELLCVAPATANILAKAACGLADDLLSTILLSFERPAC